MGIFPHSRGGATKGVNPRPSNKYLSSVNASRLLILERSEDDQLVAEPSEGWAYERGYVAEGLDEITFLTSRARLLSYHLDSRKQWICKVRQDGLTI